MEPMNSAQAMVIIEELQSINTALGVITFVLGAMLMRMLWK